MILSYVYLDATASSIIMVTLLPLATVPVLIRSSISKNVADEAELSNEQSNHVCKLCTYGFCKFAVSYTCRLCLNQCCIFTL